MNVARFILSVLEFFISVFLAVSVVFVSYKVFNKANTDFDQEEEIKKGNIAVALLLAAIMVSAATIIQKGLFPLQTLVRHYFSTPIHQSLSQWQLAAYAIAHLVMVFALSVITISFALRLYGKLTRRMKEGKELEKGNIAVGIILSAVVLIVSLYVSDSIGTISKSLIPQPSLGKIQVFR